MDKIPCPLKVHSSNDPAWIDADRVWSFRELDELADRWCAELKRRGIGPGSRVAVLHRPCVSLAALFFGAWRLGVAVCPLNLRMPPKGVETLLARLKPALFLTELNPGSEKESISEIDAKSPALLVMTSGSTSEPKIAILNFQNLLSNALHALDILDLKPNDQWLLNLPLFHVGGIGILIRCILARAAVAQAGLGITHLSCVPTQLYRATPIYKNLRCLLLGGAPVHSYPKHLPVVVTYGLTEMASIVLAKQLPENEFLGFPLPGREIRLAEDGEIWARGECLFQGYWGEERQEGWFPTKDLGAESKDGIAIVGRKDYQFISGGENIQPEEIERHLLQIEGVEEAAVISMDDPEFGARPVAFASGKIDFERMKSALAERLPKFKIPCKLFLLEELPKNGLKIDRRVLFSMIVDKKFSC